MGSSITIEIHYKFQDFSNLNIFPIVRKDNYCELGEIAVGLENEQNGLACLILPIFLYYYNQ